MHPHSSIQRTFYMVFGGEQRASRPLRLLCSILISTAAVHAQSSDWGQVRALPPGAQVSVIRFSGTGEIRGQVQSVSEEVLTVQQKSDVTTIDRAEVRRVRLITKEKSKTGRVTGAVILGSLGVLGAIGSDGNAASRAAGIGGFAGIGYLIGWAFDGRKRIIVYEADKP